MSSPKISVVMCAYNAAKYIETAIDSILAQTFADFEFIIVDDGSTDATPAILSDYAKRDGRITVLTNEENIGIPLSTNRGINAAYGSYIARLDSDDIAAPNRFELQVEYLDNNSDCVVVGTGYQEFDASGKITKTDCEPLTPSLLRWRTLFRMPFVHSSIMFRHDTLKKLKICFDPSLNASEDFDFVARLIRAGDAGLISKALTNYRMHSQNESTMKHTQQMDIAKRVCVREANNLFTELNSRDIETMFSFLYGSSALGVDETFTACATARQMAQSFAHRHRLCEAERRDQDRLLCRWIFAALLSRASRSHPIATMQSIWCARRWLAHLPDEAMSYAGRRIAPAMAG